MSSEQYLWFHPESDCYFYGDENQADGLCIEVTKDENHLAQAFELGVRMSEPRPTMRNTIRLSVEALQKAMETTPMNTKGCWRSCISCDHFNEPEEICKKFGQRPPARVIAFGCPAYDDVEDSVPF